MCMIDDCDGWKVYDRHERRARKIHRCDECGRDIQPGERYEYATGLLDDRWDEFKICAHCWAAASWLMKICNGFVHHAIQLELEDHWDEGYRSMWLGRAIVGIRRHWRGGADPIPTPFVCDHRYAWSKVCVCGHMVEAAA